MQLLMNDRISHLKKTFCLVLILAVNVACLVNEEAKENAMVDYLSKNNYLQGKAEIVFLLDRSGSIGVADFETEVGFVESFLTHIVVDVNASRVAVISYSDTVKRHIDYLKEPKSKCFLAQELHDVVYEDIGATNIAAALEEGRRVFENARPNVNKVIVLISDGLHTRGGDPSVVAAKLKSEGVQIFCFGIGRVIREYLERIASNLQNVYMATGFTEFKRLARKIRGDPHESSWSSQTSKPDCDYLCDSVYKGSPNDPGCCDPDALCSCALLSGRNTCVCKPGYFGLSGLIGNCRACPRGTYKSKLEPATSCTPCPPGSTTADIASKKLSDCFCKEGYAGDPSKEMPCKLVNCPVLQNPTNGYQLGTCDTTYGSICHFTCDDGYELVDPLNDVRSCKSNGQWTGKSAACQKVRCDTPQHPFHGRVDCEKYPLTVGTKCTFKCKAGYIIDGAKERICASSKKWTGKPVKCIPITCGVQPRLVSGNVESCKVGEKVNYGKTCFYNCYGGFELRGPQYLTCTESGRLVDKNGRQGQPKCIDITPPDIICHPSYIEVPAEEGKNVAKVNWYEPAPSDNSGYPPTLKVNPPNIFPNQMFSIGQHEVEYIATDGVGLSSNCTVIIRVTDREPPAISSCPSKVENSTNDIEMVVYWEEPVFTDNSKGPLRIKKTASSGDVFRKGSQTVRYDAYDEAGNKRTCEFQVIVSDNPCPYYPPPTNGALTCYPYMYGDMCQVFCNEKFDFTRKPAEWYSCNAESQWETYPLNETFPWPDCAQPVLPGALRQMVGFYYPGDCNDPRTQMHIKKLFLSHVRSSVKYSKLCRKAGTCMVDDVKVLCGETTVNSKRRKRSSWQQTGKEQLEIEFEITINANEEFDDMEAVMEDFRKIISSLKWNFEDDLVSATTFAPFGNLMEKEDPEILTVTEEKTTVVCKSGSVLTEDLCVLCSSGTFYDSSVEKCVDCPIGYFQKHQGQLLCEKCTEGTSTENARTRNETFCKAVCLPGTYSTTGLESCISCPIGKYQDSMGMNSCYDCPSGTTTGNVGGRSIADCKSACSPGSFSQNGLEPCVLCPLHHYQPVYGQMDCLECPDQLSTNEEGAAEIFQCIDIDPCLIDESCLNGACTREGRNAKCKCKAGFDGIHCEEDIDECTFSPCLYGGQCINTEGSFFCKCVDGFSGTLCEVEIDECASAPCENNGTCMDNVNGYSCVCSNGYEGINCEIQRELCFNDVVCLNDGLCMFGENDNSSLCVCAPGFSGIDCSQNINDCENVTCKNNGSCVDGIDSFMCACYFGYTGLFCETNINDCENNHCQSGSTCKDLVGAYECLCPPGWNGTHCENKMDSNFILMFPKSKATIANMASMTLNSSLTDATISLWVQTNDLERSGTPLSYAVASAKTINADGSIVDNALTISDCSEVKIYVNNEPIVTDLQVADGQWHHLAFTWSSENSGTWALYIDGELKREGNHLRSNEIINGGGSLIIGQEQDTLGGGFSPIETFTGNITRVNIWNSYFSKMNITQLCNMDDDMPNKVIAWPDFLQGVKGDVHILKNSKPVISKM